MCGDMTTHHLSQAASTCEKYGLEISCYIEGVQGPILLCVEGIGLVQLSWLLQEVTGGNPYLLFSLSEMPGCSRRQRNGVGTQPTRTNTAHIVHCITV